MNCKFIFHSLWLVSFFLVGVCVAKRRNGTVGRIGYRSSADSNGQVRLQLQSCQKNIVQENSNSVLARCVDQYPDVDEQFNKLVEELESTPLGLHDTASIVIMNPFNSSLKIEEIFILDSGAELSYIRPQAATDLKLGKSIGFTSIYGNGEVSLGYKSAVTVEMFQINITVVVDSAVDKSILSKQFMEIVGLCHCPRVGFVPCN